MPTISHVWYLICDLRRCSPGTRCILIQLFCVVEYQAFAVFLFPLVKLVITWLLIGSLLNGY